MTDPDALRAVAASPPDGWTIASLRDPGAIGGWLVDVRGRRIVPLREGITLLVAEAGATNGAVVRGAALPHSPWRTPVDPPLASALVVGDGAHRVSHLAPTWVDLDHGDTIEARYPPAVWTFVRAARWTRVG